MSKRNYHKHDPAPFALYNGSTTASRCITDHKNRGQKKTQAVRRSDGLPRLDKAVLAQRRGGTQCIIIHRLPTISNPLRHFIRRRGEHGCAVTFHFSETEHNVPPRVQGIQVAVPHNTETHTTTQ